MRLPRFLTGTTDHDGDGRMGGSRKGNTMAKKTTKRTTKEQNEALDADARLMASAPDPQTGQTMASEDTPTRTQVKKAQALENQFAEADGKGQPTSAEIADTNLRLAARGF